MEPVDLGRVRLQMQTVSRVWQYGTTGRGDGVEGVMTSRATGASSRARALECRLHAACWCCIALLPLLQTANGRLSSSPDAVNFHLQLQRAVISCVIWAAAVDRWCGRAPPTRHNCYSIPWSNQIRTVSSIKSPQRSERKCRTFNETQGLRPDYLHWIGLQII